MRPSELLPLDREAIRQLVLEAGMANPRVFNSVVRGEDNEDSDLDILVDPGAWDEFDDNGASAE
jgi:predicted nucleotidyltransferase